ncbi:preprotein translocase subunit SecA [bacterium]|nr:preprotein translocase subunit SecA [candidate division CSSED10-310 bacterium]
MITTLFKMFFGSKDQREIKKIMPIVDEINSLEPKMRAMSDAGLRGNTVALRRRLAGGECLDALLPEAFATVREASRRVLGMRHFDVQLIGGIVLHRGKIAEMKTGEGKTLVATLAVYLNALTGRGVHVVTVNDYLARRDAEWMGGIYRFLGLTVGTIQHDMDDWSRYMAYRADVTYATNNELGFDYLRDNMKTSLSAFVQRNHHYAIVDEVDSILIDEARTPLIISGPAEESTDKYYKINQLIPRLTREVDFQIDEKSRSVSLTDSGVGKSEGFLKGQGLLPGDSPNLYDAENMEVLHHVNQALKAHALFKRDVDYVVKEQEVIIVDEFTGRLMPGRRYSDGLHQALEAKERVKIANENQTLASVTFQNYFRMYEKLAGMTGTAETEAAEFFHTYKLDVVVIPTNRPLIREEYSDVIYKTAAEKFKAVVNEIKELHAAGRPVLVGTISIENSEMLSRILKRDKIAHEVLNAKYHEQEAQIVSRAGQAGAVTISTNMAGRGTDIVLGPGVVKCPRDELGNILCCVGCDKNCADCPKEDKKEAYAACLDKVPCGLHIIGTERHESRRIDNQLRGRSGRMGDPGSSRFYISLEDDLMRIFGSERVKAIMDRLGMEEDVPIEAKMVSRAIESAQRKVEANNFSIRKHLLEYDDVMNKQREIVYRQRRDVLSAVSIKPVIIDMADAILDEMIAALGPDRSRIEDVEHDELNKGLQARFNLKVDLLDRFSPETALLDVREDLRELVHDKYEEKESIIGTEPMRQFEKDVMLWVIDSLWKDHLLAMDYLREGIGLRGYGQQDPLTEYKKEGFQLFEEMIQRIQEDVLTRIMLTQFDPGAMPVKKRAAARRHLEGRGGAADRQPAKRILTADGKQHKIGRNDPCWCGSGKKFKKCHGR